MGRRYLLLGAVTAGWGTIPVLASVSQLPSSIIVAIRLWTAAICLAGVLAVDAWRVGHGRSRVGGRRLVGGGDRGRG
ncbi:MAG: hypothetical protein M3083_16035, partial [Actinomycetota bacterium]|nr:hypothetical protein [Actinomycetota bacterium]MDQ6948438.1 hypothetical protein [Actinomycetota bacterium]